MLGLSTGLSALRVSQRALDTIGQNIANANTPGYHRQVISLSTRLPVELDGLSIGTGVQITDIRRLHDRLLENALTQHASESGHTTAQLDTLRHLEALLATGAGSIHDTMEEFFTGLEQLSTKPGDDTLRRVVLGTGAALSNEFNYVSSEFDRLMGNLDLQIDGAVKEINALAKQVAELNIAIQRAAARDISANDLLDQRDQIIKQLGELTGIRTVEADQSQVNIFLEGGSLVVSNQATTLEVSTDSAGNKVITAAGSDEPIDISGGKLGAYLQLRNEIVPEFHHRIEELAHEFIRATNGVHATGVGLNGSFTFLAGDNAVLNPTLPLAQANLSFPPQAGSLFITVTDLATGQRTLSELAIDPATQSLNDIATALSAISGVQAIVDPQSQSLKIFAQGGYTFDFAGQLPTGPSSIAVTGTALPQIGGTYSGSNNDTYTFRVIGTGTIGVTPNLKLQVTNSAGGVIASLNIGEGYEPGKVITAVNGVTVQLSAGTVNDGDNFTVRVVAQPDTAGILGALGLAGLFSGSDARDIRLNGDVLADPSRLAASRSGLPGDASNLARLLAIRDQPVLSGGTETLREGYASILGDVAISVQGLGERQTHQELLGERLEAERQSVSGVDANEELVRLVQFQRSFQMAAKYINVVSETLDELTRLV